MRQDRQVRASTDRIDEGSGGAVAPASALRSLRIAQALDLGAVDVIGERDPGRFRRVDANWCQRMKFANIRYRERTPGAKLDRKRVVSGQSVSVRVGLGGRR